MKHKAYIYSVYQVGVCIATTAHSQCNLLRRLAGDRKVRRVYTTLMPFDGARGFEAKDTGDTLSCVFNVLLDNFPRYTLRSVPDSIRFVASELQQRFHAASIKVIKNTTEQPTDTLLTPNQWAVYADKHGLSAEFMDKCDQGRQPGTAGFTSAGSVHSTGRALYEEGHRSIQEWAEKSNKRSAFEAEMDEEGGAMLKKAST